MDGTSATGISSLQVGREGEGVPKKMGVSSENVTEHEEKQGKEDTDLKKREPRAINKISN